MSRIGKNPIQIPSDIKVDILTNCIAVIGKKEESKIDLPDFISASIKDGFLYLNLNTVTKNSQSLYGLKRSLIANSINGISKGFTKTLDINGVGYRAQMEGKDLIVSAGYSHPVKVSIPEGISIKLEGARCINIMGSQKDVIGELAAKIRSIRPPEPYKGKGIQYRGEFICRKAGKGGKK